MISEVFCETESDNLVKSATISSVDFPPIVKPLSVVLNIVPIVYKLFEYLYNIFIIILN